MAQINWLHLSDLHTSAGQAFDQSVVHDAMLRDIEQQIVEYNIELSFIFVTGDIAYSATEKDYAYAIEFLQNLCGGLNVDKKMLFVVPGNHDVNRYRVSRLLDENRRGFKTREEIRQVLENRTEFERYLSRFDNYSKFIGDLYGIPYTMNPENYFYGKMRTVDGVRVGIIGLNSAWSSYGGRNDSNNIYISEMQLNHAIAEVSSATLKIVLMHHPVSWLYEEDMADIENIMYQHCHVILYGHLHRPDFQSINSIRGQQIAIPAGAIYMGRRVTNSYNIAAIDIDKEKFRIIPRRYYDGPRKFLKDIESLGDDNIAFFEADVPEKIMKSIQIET